MLYRTAQDQVEQVEVVAEGETEAAEEMAAQTPEEAEALVQTLLLETVDQAWLFFELFQPRPRR